LQGLRDKGQIQARQKVLINGASGGLGTFAVQIAKSFEAEVTGVCSTTKMDFVRSIVLKISPPTRIAFKGSCLMKAMYPVISSMFCNACSVTLTE